MREGKSEHGRVPNLYSETACFYDHIPAGEKHKRDEIGFYLDQARNIQGAVLELGCGTGRITLPLAESGKQVWGLDLSLAMLRILEAKLQRYDPSVKERIRLVHGSMANFDLGQKFELIIVPFFSFMVLTEEADRQSCLSCVRSHLEIGGTFIFDIDSTPLAPASEPREITRLQWVDPNSGSHLRYVTSLLNADLEKRITRQEHSVYETKLDGSLQVHKDAFMFSHLQADEIRQMLIAAHFEITQETGYFDGRPVSMGSHTIFICT